MRDPWDGIAVLVCWTPLARLPPVSGSHPFGTVDVRTLTIWDPHSLFIIRLCRPLPAFIPPASQNLACMEWNLFLSSPIQRSNIQRAMSNSSYQSSIRADGGCAFGIRLLYTLDSSSKTANCPFGVFFFFYCFLLASIFFLFFIPFIVYAILKSSLSLSFFLWAGGCY